MYFNIANRKGIVVSGSTSASAPRSEKDGKSLPTPPVVVPGGAASSSRASAQTASLQQLEDENDGLDEVYFMHLFTYLFIGYISI